jgi:hypothetical protein
MTVITSNPPPDFWALLYSRCQYLGETAIHPAETNDFVISQLYTLVEAFDKNFDPAEQFKEYMVLMLCKAVAQKLEQAKL